MFLEQMRYQQGTAQIKSRRMSPLRLVPAPKFALSLPAAGRIVGPIAIARIVRRRREFLPVCRLPIAMEEPP
jgi:hypothetical protein